MTSPNPGDGRHPPSRLAATLSRALRFLTERIERTLPPESRPHLVPFTSRFQSGVFVVESARTVRALGQEAAASGLRVARINGHGIRTKAAFLAAADRDLAFPEYFGHNWDAFADCLGDFAAASAGGTVLILTGFDELARTAPRDWQTALAILSRATEERRNTDRPFYVFLQGSRDAAPDIPSFDAANR